MCDDDKTGSIHKDELYTGVILVHLKIASKWNRNIVFSFVAGSLCHSFALISTHPGFPLP